MRKLLTFLSAMCIIIAAQSQAPEQFNYQGVARKSNGHPLDNKNIRLRLSIREGSAIGPVVYQERRATTTNAFGLFNIAIGSPGATSVIGTIGGVNWAVGNKFIQVEMDPNGGSSFINMGTQQLLSVPFALNASGAAPIGVAGGDLTGTYPNPTVARIRGVNVNGVTPTMNYVLGYDGTNWTPTSLAIHPDNYWRLSGGNIYNSNTANVGIGTPTPLYKLDVNGTLRTLGFIMPTGAGDGKFLRSDASGVGTWSSSIAATSIILPYKDSASSESDNIFHIIQTSPSSGTGALYGETRSSGFNAFAVGGSAMNGIGVKGLSITDYGVYGNSANTSAVFGHTTSGAGYRAGVFGYSTSFGGNGTFGYGTMQYGFGALGISEQSTGVYGQTNSPTFSAYANDGAAVYALATSGGTGVFSNSYTGIAGRFESLNPLNNNNILEALTNGSGRSGWFENTNATNTSTTLHVTSNGLGRAIVGRSQMPGYVNGGVIDALTTTVGGNAVFGRGTRFGGWGVYGLSDSAAGVAGIGYRNVSVGVLGQGWQGKAGQFVIDNTFLNTNNTVEVSNTQSGNGVDVSVATGTGVFSNSNLGLSGRFENTNAANTSTTLEVVSNGSGRAIYAQSNLPGPVFGGVIHSHSATYGSNAIYARATKPLGWGVAAISDSSVAVGGIGYRSGSVGIYGQGYSGTAAQFIIDNSFPNTSNAVEVSNTQSGSGILVNLTNSAWGLDVKQAGNGTGVRSNSNLGVSGRIENTNAANPSTTLEVISNGNGRAIMARSNLPGPVNGGVVDALTQVYGSNAFYARATRPLGWGVASLSDSSVAVGGIGYRQGSVGIYGQGWGGTAGQFVIDNTFTNTSNTLEVSNSQSGNGIVVNVNNAARGLDVFQNGAGNGVRSNSADGVAGRFENTNAVNNFTTLEAISNGTGRAFVGRSQMPGYVNGGVIDGLTTTVGGNAIFGRGTRPGGWGIYGLSDSSAGVSGIGIRLGSIGVSGQSYAGVAGKFTIDNTLANGSNVVEVSNTQNGHGVHVYLSNPGTFGNGINSQTNGYGTAISGFSEKGYGVVGVSTNNTWLPAVLGYHAAPNGAGVTGFVTRNSSTAVTGYSDSGYAFYGSSGLSTGGSFNNYSSNAFMPALSASTNGQSNAATFFSFNTENVADAVYINSLSAGRSLHVTGASFLNPMDFYSPQTTGKSTLKVQGRSGLGIFSHASGSFFHGAGERVAVGVYGMADSIGSQYNYGLVGNAKGGVLENAGVIGWLGSGATGTNVNAAIYGYVTPVGPASRYAGLFDGNVHVTGTISKGAGSFKIDHPQDPENKYLVHSFVESPDMMNVYNGNIVTGADGKVVVDLPSYFEAENIDFKYQLTVIGQFAQAIIGEEIKNNQFVILTDKPNVKVSWQVTGVRNDKYAQQNRIVPEVEKSAAEKGRYLYPTLYGKPHEEGIGVLKTNMPKYSGEDNSVQKPNTMDPAMEEMKKEVEQRRIRMNAQIQKLALSEKLKAAQPGVDEKVKSLSTTLAITDEKMTTTKDEKVPVVQSQEEKIKSLHATLPVLIDETPGKVEEEKKGIQTQDEKIKQMAMLTDKNEEPAKQEDRSKSKQAQANDEKSKKLSASTETTETQNKAGEKDKQFVSPVEKKKLANPADIKLPGKEGKKD